MNQSLKSVLKETLIHGAFFGFGFLFGLWGGSTQSNQIEPEKAKPTTRQYANHPDTGHIIAPYPAPHGNYINDLKNGDWMYCSNSLGECIKVTVLENDIYNHKLRVEGRGFEGEQYFDYGFFIDRGAQSKYGTVRRKNYE